MKCNTAYKTRIEYLYNELNANEAVKKMKEDAQTWRDAN